MKQMFHSKGTERYRVRNGKPILGAVFLILLFLFNQNASRLGASDLDDAMQAVVRVRATIPVEAATAAVLGTEREGNGILIDSNGLVLTIGYLILEANSIEVETRLGSFEADFVGYDGDTGFGLIRADKLRGKEPIQFGDSSYIKTGDYLHVGGFGEAPQPVRVILREEFVGYWEYLLDNAIYVAPVFNQYGGAALISDGKLVGIGSILTAFIVEGFGRLPANMFVPIDLLKPILKTMINTGYSGLPARPWLGVYSADFEGRVVVTSVTPGAPAEQAGLRPGDIILAVAQHPVSRVSEFYRNIWSLGPAGVKITLRVLQGDEIREITVQSVDRNSLFHQSRKRPGMITLLSQSW